MGEWWNWQTRQIQVLVFTADVRVQVPPRPPKNDNFRQKVVVFSIIRGDKGLGYSFGVEFTFRQMKYRGTYTTAVKNIYIYKIFMYNVGKLL